jgi:hypothetical protein
MLSYKTILAIQILYLLHKADEGGLTISELKYQARLDVPGMGQAVRRLYQCHWLSSGTKYRYIIKTDLQTKTLYDLVMAMDGAVMLGAYIDKEYVPFWGAAAKELMPHMVDFNEILSLQFSKMLLHITLKDVIAGRKLSVNKLNDKIRNEI